MNSGSLRCTGTCIPSRAAMGLAARRTGKRTQASHGPVEQGREYGLRSADRTCPRMRASRERAARNAPRKLAAKRIERVPDVLYAAVQIANSHKSTVRRTKFFSMA